MRRSFAVRGHRANSESSRYLLTRFFGYPWQFGVADLARRRLRKLTLVEGLLHMPFEAKTRGVLATLDKELIALVATPCGLFLCRPGLVVGVTPDLRAHVYRVDGLQALTVALGDHEVFVITYEPPERPRIAAGDDFMAETQRDWDFGLRLERLLGDEKRLSQFVAAHLAPQGSVTKLPVFAPSVHFTGCAEAH